MDNILSKFIGQEVNLDKIFMAIYAALVVLLVWGIITAVVYFWFKIKLWKRFDFWLTAGTIAILVAVKAYFFNFMGNYYLDRLPIYALLSPKIESYAAVFFALVIFLFFLKYYGKLLKIDKKIFLAILIIFFMVFSFAVAFIRDGSFGVYETFTRRGMDYFDDVLRVDTVGNFLKNYDVLIYSLSMHGSVHPPGNIVILYFLAQIFKFNLLSMAAGVIFCGALTLIPVFYLARQLSQREDFARLSAILFSLSPAYVMFTATSMDTLFLLAATILLFTIARAEKLLDWIFAGVSFALTLFFHFIAGIFFPIIAIWSYLKNKNLKKTISEMAVFTISFAAVYLLAKIFIGYDIARSFFATHNRLDLNVGSNFSSVELYFIYLGMSILPFWVYLSWPNILAYFDTLKTGLLAKGAGVYGQLAILGAGLILFLYSLGIFQGENERIWLFLLPFFVLPGAKAIIDRDDVAPVLSLLFLQIISIQILFYTYW